MNTIFKSWSDIQYVENVDVVKKTVIGASPSRCLLT